MQGCCTNTVDYSVSYKWEILNFQNYTNMKNRKININLRSTNFILPPNKNGKFWLAMVIPVIEEEEEACIKCYLHWNDVNDDPMIKNNLSIITSKNTKYNMCSFDTSCATEYHKSTNRGWPSYIKLSELLDRSADLLPNNTLTLQCDLIVYESKSKAYDTRYITEPRLSSRNPFKTFFDNQLYTDFTFHVGNEEFKAHKTFLIAQSPVFQAMFDNEMSEKMNNHTEITDIRPEIFKIFLEYIYTNEFTVGIGYEDTIELLAAADKYQMDALKEKCFQLLSMFIEPKNAVHICLLAGKYRNSKLAELAKNFIHSHNGDRNAFEYLLEHADITNSLKLSEASMLEDVDVNEYQDEIEDE